VLWSSRQHCHTPFKVVFPSVQWTVLRNLILVVFERTFH